MIISKVQFELYEEVREGGRTNMYHLANVEALSGLDRETIKEIQRRYSELKEKYEKVEEWPGRIGNLLLTSLC